jgi:hypothetical protein
VLLFRRLIQQRANPDVALLPIVLASLGSLLVVAYIEAAVPFYSTSSSSSALLRFSYTAVPASFLTLPFALQAVRRRIRVVVDVVSSLLMLNQSETIYKFLTQLLEEVKGYDAVLLATLEEGMHKPEVLTAMQQLFDGVVELRLYEEGLRVLPLMRIRKMRGVPPQPGYYSSRSPVQGWRSVRMLSSSGIVYLVVVAAAVLMFSYAAYWGFSIRRALYVRVYRNQALGVGLVAASFVVVLLGVAALTSSVPENVNPGPALTPYGALGVLTLLYWIDTSMLAARRSDPLLRDTLHWKRLRVVFWAGSVLAFGLLFTASVYLLGPLALVDPLVGAGTAPPPALVPLILTPFFLPGLAGLLLLIAVRRSKDINLQRSLRWLGLFAVSLLVGFASGAFTGSLVSVEHAGNTTLNVGLLAGGYFLYKSAKALVPLNRMESGEFDADSRLKLGAIPSIAGWLNTLTSLVSHGCSCGSLLALASNSDHSTPYACCQMSILRKGFA